MHKAEPVNNNRVQEKLAELLEWAERSFDFTPENVRGVMRLYEINAFRVEEFGQYQILIRKAYERMVAKGDYPQQCPICGEPTSRDTSNDGKFGAKYGWQCPNKHFISFRMRTLQEKLKDRIIDEIPETSTG
jgi:hypothetical protein